MTVMLRDIRLRYLPVMTDLDVSDTTKELREWMKKQGGGRSSSISADCCGDSEEEEKEKK